ncbi:MAG TPA: GAF domain-containing protein [Pirellulales bacterium]|jgi:PAS domain S-box-containing protein
MSATLSTTDLSPATAALETALRSVVAETPAAGQLSADIFRRRSEVLVSLGRRAAAAPSWRTLAFDAAALVAETLETDQFALAELTSDGGALAIRMANTSQSRDAADSKPHLAPFNEQDSMAGFALTAAQVIDSADLWNETRFRDSLLRQRKLHSAAAVPLMRAGESFGALLVAHLQPRPFAADELQYLETIAHLVSTTIAHERVCHELEKERRFQEAVLETSAALNIVLSAAGKIEQVNRSAAAVLQFEPEELHERSFVTTLLVPEDIASMQQCFEKLAASIEPLSLETLVVTKQSQRRKILWSISGLCDRQARVERIVLNGIDVTRQREIELELTQVRQTAQADGAPRPFSVVPAGPEADRRQRSRRSFPYVQMIAPMVDGQPPQDHQFRSVRCRDISPTGFSYLSTTPPDFQDLMVALGSDSTTTYLAARVMHATIVERDNKIAYVVGCRYLARANGAMPGKP